MQDSDFVSGHTLTALARMERILSVVHGERDNETGPVQPPERGEPYAVEKYRGVNNTIVLVGRDGRGEIMLEMRMPATMYSVRMVGRLVRSLKAHDPSPSLSLVP